LLDHFWFLIIWPVFWRLLQVKSGRPNAS